MGNLSADGRSDWLLSNHPRVAGGPEKAELKESLRLRVTARYMLFQHCSGAWANPNFGGRGAACVTHPSAPAAESLHRMPFVPALLHEFIRHRVGASQLA